MTGSRNTAGSAIAFVDSFAAILALRVLQGVGGAGIVPIAITVLGDVYSGPTGSAAQGFRLSANGLSGIMLPVVAGFVAGIAWYYPFLLYAVAIPVAVLAYVYVPETLDTDAPVSFTEEIRGYAVAIRSEASDPDMFVILMGGFFQGFAYYAILTFVPLFAVERLGATVFVAGSVLAARGVARIFLSPFSGSLLKRFSRKTALVLTLVVSALGTGLIAVAPTVVGLAVIVGLFGVGDALFTPVHRFAVTDLATPERRAGIVSGMGLLRQLGATLSPAAFGLLLVVIGYSGIFVVAAGVYGLYALMVLVVFSTDG
jgi:MFS family permease